MDTDRKEAIRTMLYKSADEGAKKMKPFDLTQFIPFMGGAVHGVGRPAEGTSRLESMIGQGAFGAGGGMMGAGAGGAVGAYLTKDVEDVNTRAKLIALMSLIGAGLGTGAGSATGRVLMRRETMTPSDWKALAQGMREQGVEKTAGQRNRSTDYEDKTMSKEGSERKEAIRAMLNKQASYASDEDLDDQIGGTLMKDRGLLAGITGAGVGPLLVYLMKTNPKMQDYLAASGAGALTGIGAAAVTHNMGKTAADTATMNPATRNVGITPDEMEKLKNKYPNLMKGKLGQKGGKFTAKQNQAFARQQKPDQKQLGTETTVKSKNVAGIND